MKGLSNEERQGLGALLDSKTQVEVRGMIPQFAEAQIHNEFAAPANPTKSLGVLMFNRGRGVHLAEIKDFLAQCPQVSPFDIILANELDDGCVRSGDQDVAAEIGKTFGLHYVYGWEFIELANPNDQKGFHGNAVFSRYPITWAGVLRLPEEYNWYFDRQRRIGGRCAIFARVNVSGYEVGVVSIHLENRAAGAGRHRQTARVFTRSK